jgi:1,4-alpha-glucan branching enzyme
MESAEKKHLAGYPEMVDSLLAGQCGDPHGILGAHPLVVKGKKGVVFRAYHPDAKGAKLYLNGKSRQMTPLKGGLFALHVAAKKLSVAYEFEFAFANGTTLRNHDAYAFEPTLGDMDLHLKGEGRHFRLYERFGAHPRTIEGVSGTAFAVWAPHARRVSVVGPFNQWDGRRFPMRLMGASGIWEIFIPGVGRGELYKFEVLGAKGNVQLKSDPLSFMMELRPNTASVVWGLGEYQWGDDAWLEARKSQDARKQKMSIYEVHLGSWMRSPDHDNGWLSYRELADRLVEHASSHGFTHIELLPISEHAFDPSWGYQVTGFYAPTSRFGEPDDLRYLIDRCHQRSIGVILDWVPGHFPKDASGLARFDGTALYEHQDPRQGEHLDWGTLIFNYGRNETRSFLISNALYWLDQFHFDGLRVDAVASMIYLDYSRDDWVPNQDGGRENLEAIEFLRQMNTEVYGQFPGTFTIAEESTAWTGVTLPVDRGGLGFGFKWDMGWMHDTLRYLSKDPIYRNHHHNDLTFSMLYAYGENYVLPLSHDEVVHMKGSLWGRMPGDDWQKAANVRLLLSFLYTHVGKKLLFMGGEFGQRREWNHDHSLDWHLCVSPIHGGIQRLVKDVGALYDTRDALWAWDSDPKGFRWIDCDDSEQSVISFIRKGPSSELVCVFNFTPIPRHNYRVGFPQPGVYLEKLNTDASFYGGSNMGNGGQITTEFVPAHDQQQSALLTLPPLGALVFEKE